MKKILPVVLALVAISVTPLVSLAATYQYVNTSGTLVAISADSSSDAFALATDRDPASGVMLITPIPLTSIPSITTVVTTPETTTSASSTDTDTSSTTSTASTTSSGAPVIWSAPGTYTVNLPEAGTTPGAATASTTNQLTLTLTPQGSATLVTDYGNGQPSMTETGTWSSPQNNQVALTLTGNSTQTYTTPETTIFTQNGTGLNATQYDTSVYGSNGLNFTAQNNT